MSIEYIIKYLDMIQLFNYLGKTYIQWNTSKYDTRLIH